MTHDPALSQIAKRARERWILSVSAAAVVLGIGVPLLVILLAAGHGSAEPTNAAAGLLVTGVVVISMLLVLTLLGPRRWRDQGIFAPPLIAGLDRADRRKAVRAVRRGSPSEQPTMVVVETASAQRLISQARTSKIMFPLFVTLEVVQAVIQHNLFAKAFFIVAAVMFVIFALVQAQSIRGARRYLAALVTS